MSLLTDQICSFLKEEGFSCSQFVCNGLRCISVSIQTSQYNRIILPLSISAADPHEAKAESEQLKEWIKHTISEYGRYPLIVTEDRWNIQNKMMKARILSHLEVFSPIYARNCEVRKIDKATAKEFLESNHTYGHAACRYCYGLFFKRHTGHIAQNDETHAAPWQPVKGELMAVATFSNARKWVKGERTIRSYEWTRYASLPEVRLSGGMGRLMKTFIKEVCPDDLMSYADLEWSKGDVYRRLGFELEGTKAPVMFAVDDRWRRFPVKPGMTEERTGMTRAETGMRFFRNFGSNKFRLKLTDYE